jgi:N-carbamoylputrescine amidase
MSVSWDIGCAIYRSPRPIRSRTRRQCAGGREAVQVGAAKVAFVVCTELWAFQKACEYGKAGAHVLVTPRLTARGSVDKLLAGGRAAAVISGA